jgi:cytochrome c2
MRIKTLGIVLMSAMSLFTAFYWLTDPARREAAYQTQLKELLAYGEEMFGANTAGNDHTAECSKCHGVDGRSEGADTIGPNLHSKSIYEKLKTQNGGSFTDIHKPGDPPDYVNLVIRFGGVVVSGNPSSLMPAWSSEVGGALTVNQIDALTALVESWVLKAAAEPDEQVPNTVAAGQKVFSDSGCAACHAADLSGGLGPNLQNIGNEPVIDLPVPISHLAELQADYAAGAPAFLERWIRDSAVNYNDGTATNMPVHPEGKISVSALQALITFLLSQKL